MKPKDELYFHKHREPGYMISWIKSGRRRMCQIQSINLHVHQACTQTFCLSISEVYEVEKCSSDPKPPQAAKTAKSKQNKSSHSHGEFNRPNNGTRLFFSAHIHTIDIIVGLAAPEIFYIWIFPKKHFQNHWRHAHTVLTLILMWNHN